MRPTPRRRLAAPLLALAALAACTENRPTGLALDRPALHFVSFVGDAGTETQRVTVRWAAGWVAALYVQTSGDPLPSWLAVDLAGDVSPVTLAVHRTALPGAAGHHQVTLRVLAADATGATLETVDLPVTLDVLAAPIVSPTSLTLAWPEGELPAPAQLQVTVPEGMALLGATVDVPWLDAATAGEVVTVSATDAAAHLVPGDRAASVHLRLDLQGQEVELPVPVSATVTTGLQAPAELTVVVNAGTTADDLARLAATVSVAGPAPVQLTASADVPWLAVTSPFTTGAAGNLALAIPLDRLQALANGAYQGVVTVTDPAGRLRPVQVAVSLTVQLPAVHRVAPVAFTDTATSDYVVVRGEHLAAGAPPALVDGQPAAQVTYVSDTELHVVPGPAAAGDHALAVGNALGLPREAGTLRVVAPPSYGNARLNAALGLQEQVLATSEGLVFTTLCYFCGVSGGTPGTLQRFAWDAGTGTWSRSQYSYPELYAAALSLDERRLYVLTRTDLWTVDPASMATVAKVALPSPVSGTARLLAVTNDGRVLVQTTGQAYLPASGAFVEVPGLVFSLGLGGSRDGGRVAFGEATNSGDVAYRYYDASTGQVVETRTFEHYSRGLYSRHAERALANGYYLDRDLALVASLPLTSHTGDLSPDGRYVYAYDPSTPQLQVMDVADPQQPRLLAPYAVGALGAGRIAVHPRGTHAFVVGENGFQVVDLRR